MSHALDRLLNATRDAIGNANEFESSCEQAHLLASRLAEPMAQLDIDARRIETMDPGLKAAVSAAGERERPLAQALLKASSKLRWISPYSTDDGAPVELCTGYASTMLVGTGMRLRDYQAPYIHPKLFVAFTLQLPNLFYPLHRHRAGEIYHIISGRAEWLRGDEPWQFRDSGSWLFHPSLCGHAMRTHHEPLLCLAAWIDHLDAPPPVLELD